MNELVDSEKIMKKTKKDLLSESYIREDIYEYENWNNFAEKTSDYESKYKLSTKCIKKNDTTSTTSSYIESKNRFKSNVDTSDSKYVLLPLNYDEIVEDSPKILIDGFVKNTEMLKKPIENPLSESCNHKIDWDNIEEKSDEELKFKRSTKYIESCPDIDRLMNRSGLRSSTKCLIKNGNLCKPATIGKQKYIIYNTCPFDSILASVVIGYIEYKMYRIFIDDQISTNRFLSMCREVACHKTINKIYQIRAQILIDYFKCSNTIAEINSVFAQCNISVMTEILLVGNPSCFERHTCENCSATKTFRNVLLILPRNKGQWIMEHHLQIAISDYFNVEHNKLCKGCKTNGETISKEPQVTIRIETDWIMDECSISNIPLEITITTKK